MDLVAATSTACNIDDNAASKALGAVFTAIRMSVDTMTFSKVVAAFPRCSTWMRETPTATGQTGALLALATPATLKKGLLQQGLDENAVKTLGRVVGQAVATEVSPSVAALIAKKLPLIKG